MALISNLRRILRLPDPPKQYDYSYMTNLVKQLQEDSYNSSQPFSTFWGRPANFAVNRGPIDTSQATVQETGDVLCTLISDLQNAGKLGSQGASTSNVSPPNAIDPVIEAELGSLLVAGTNVAIAHNAGAHTYTISSAGGAGGAGLSNATPLALGTASAGVGVNASRDDHVHPMTKTDTITKNWYNVLNYGAVGDGATDDTAAIQTLINARATGDVVFFPPSSYVISSLTMKPGVALVGAGPESSILIGNSSSTSMITYTAAAAQSGFLIKDLKLTAAGKTSLNGIVLDGTDGTKRLTYVWVANLHIDGSFQNGIYIRFCNVSKILNSVIVSATNGFVNDNSADTDLINVSARSGSGYGFTIENDTSDVGDAVRLANCSTTNQAGGIQVVNQSFGSVVGCRFVTGTATLLAMTGATNWQFSSCQFTPNSGAVTCASIDSGSTTNSFDNCLFTAGNAGVLLNGGSCSVSNCTFVANAAIDITLGTGVTRTTLTGNICKSVGNVISITESASCDNNVIVANNCVGNIHLIGAHTVSANNIPISSTSGVMQTASFGMFSVRDFGAVGDGVTDDYTPIQAALDAAFNAGGGIVMVPPSGHYYKISHGLFVRAGVTLAGCGAKQLPDPNHGPAFWARNGSWILSTDTVNYAVNLGDHGAAVRDLNFVYIQPAGVLGWTPNVFPFCIRIGGFFCHIDNVMIIGATHGIIFDYAAVGFGGAGCTVNNVYLNVFNIGIKTDTVDDVIYLNEINIENFAYNDYINAYNFNNLVGIWYKRADGHVLSNSQIFACAYGMFFETIPGSVGSAGGTVVNTQITLCTNIMGISDSNTLISGLQFCNCFFQNTPLSFILGGLTSPPTPGPIIGLQSNNIDITYTGCSFFAYADSFQLGNGSAPTLLFYPTAVITVTGCRVYYNASGGSNSCFNLNNATVFAAGNIIHDLGSGGLKGGSGTITMAQTINL